MYFKNIETGEVFQTDGGVYLDSVEITEEEFLVATVKPEITIQPDGIENSGGSIVGENLASTKTLEFNAADGSAMFAAGAATIGATGLIMSKVDIRCANPDGSIGITSLDQASWVVRLTKSSLAYTNGNVYPATGRPTFNNSTGATLADLAAYQPKLTYTPVQQGTGIDQLSNTVKIGWGDQTKYPGRLRATVDTTDLGNIVTDAYLNSGKLPIYGSTVSAAGLMTATHIVVNGVKDWGSGHLSSTVVNASYIRALNKDTGFDMDSGDRPIIERLGGDARVAALSEVSSIGKGIVSSGSGAKYFWVLFGDGTKMITGVSEQIWINDRSVGIVTVTLPISLTTLVGAFSTSTLVEIQATGASSGAPVISSSSIAIGIANYSGGGKAMSATYTLWGR